MCFDKEKDMIALVDCNNFYVSCERVFRPWLRKRPVVVLSSNDGCVIARSQEAKNAGIAMGVPIHKVTELIHQYDIQVCSANFTLYADMSRRVYDALRQYSEQVEVYSIDESFLELIGSKDLLRDTATNIRNTILQWTDIPTCVGLGSTKTLAKIGNRIAKMNSIYKGVYVVDDNNDDALQSIAVEDIWGIGRQWAKKLKSYGIVNALALKNADDKLLRQKFNVVLLRTATELRGTPCISVADVNPPNKTIIATSSFGNYLTQKHELEQSITSFTSRAAEKLRRQESIALHLSVFIRTNMFNKNLEQYSAGTTITMDAATAYTPTLVDAARKGLDRIFREGYYYKKAGVVLSMIIPQTVKQQGLFYAVDYNKEQGAMKAMDRINLKYGKGTLKIGTAGTKRIWSPKLEKRSPLFTTKYEDILVVKA